MTSRRKFLADDTVASKSMRPSRRQGFAQVPRTSLVTMSTGQRRRGPARRTFSRAWSASVDEISTPMTRAKL